MPPRTQVQESASPLRAGAKFIGSRKDLLNYSTLSGFAISDAPGKLFVQQSGDGTNFDLVKEIAVSPNIGQELTVRLVLRFARVTYENDANPQSFFRLYSSYE